MSRIIVTDVALADTGERYMYVSSDATFDNHQLPVVAKVVVIVVAVMIVNTLPRVSVVYPS